MKKIEAVIKPLKLDDVKEKLSEIGVSGLTITEVKGVGRQGRKSNLFISSQAEGGLPKVCLEIVVDDAQVEEVIAAIMSAGRTDRVGDGKIFVTDLGDVIRVRTGERGPQAV